MSLAYIGPVPIGLHGNPQASWSGGPTSSGIRDAKISGVISWTEAHQLSELTTNPELSRTIGGVTGVLERVWFTDELLGPFRGWYLLGNFDGPQGDHQSSLHDLVGFSLSASLLPAHLRPQVDWSSRTLPNDFALVGQPVIASPFYTADGAAALLVDSGGTLILREYDELSPHVTGRRTEALIP